jgi:hypothetical protein
VFFRDFSECSEEFWCFFGCSFNNVHMQYRMNEIPSLSSTMRLNIGEALWCYRDESTMPVRWVVLRVGIWVVA